MDRDLDWIVLKCLEKDRTRRYSTAQELAADLQRYLSQEPVLARPQSTAYRLQKALRRHRAAFAAAAAILLVVVAGSAVSFWQALRATSAERVAEQGRRNEEVLRRNAERERGRAIQSQERAELNEYVADINLAHQSILAGNLARATELLAKHRDASSRRFEWRYLWHAAQGDDHRLFAQEPSSVLSLACSPEWAVVGLQDSVRIYDLKTGSLVKALDRPGLSVALSPAGFLATAGRSAVRVWRTSDWVEAWSLPEHAAPIAFSPDGRYLAANSPKGVQLYSSADGRVAAEIPGSMPPFGFSLRGNVIAADSGQGVVLWDLEAAKPMRILRQSEGIFADFRMREKNALVFSPDGDSVIAARNILREGSIFVLDVWSCATGEKVASMPATRNVAEHAGMVSGIAFAPGGQILASASHDHSIRLWDLESRECVERLRGSPSEVWALAFTCDGQGILSGAKDGTVRLWPTNAAAKERLYEGNWTPIKFSKDGRTLAVIDDQSRFALLNLRTGEPDDRLQLGRRQWGAWAGAISDDFRVLVDPLPEGGIRVWDLESRKSVDIASRETRIPWTAISPDGTSLLAGERGGAVLWWNLQNPSEAPLRIEGNSALISRDGSALVVLQERSIKRWNPKSRSPGAEFPVEADLGFPTPLGISDDGAILAAGSNPLRDVENAIRLWDTRNGKFLGVCKGHSQGVRWLTFSPDGETLASVSDDSNLRFWDVRTQQELLSIQRLADPFREILFSPDGNWLAAKTVGGLRLLSGPRDRDPAKTTVSGPSSGVP